MEEVSIEEHNYLIDMGFVRKEFEDGSGFWYSLVKNNVGFFSEVDIVYEPNNGSLIFYMSLSEDDEPLEATYFTDMYDLIMIEAVLVSSGIIPHEENRRMVQ